MQDKKIRKIRNLIGTVLLISSLAVTQLPVSGMAAGRSTQSDFQMDGTTLVGYTGTATTVSVPDFIKTIGAGAFSGDNDLYTVYLPDGLTRIAADAFAGCKLLTVVDIPESLEEIGDFAFSGCESLTDVQLDKKVMKIGDGAFADCKNLSDISIDKENPYLSSYGGALYNSDKTKLYQVYAGSEYTKYTMPQSVEEMRPFAFWGCDMLRFAYFGSNIKEVPMYGCSNSGLEEMTLPYSVKTISVKAFADCKNLQKIEIPPTVTYIHETAFDGCPKLTIEAQEGSAGQKFDDTREKSVVAAAEYEDTAAQGIAASYPQSGDVAQVTGQPAGTQGTAGAGQAFAQGNGQSGGGSAGVSVSGGIAADTPAVGNGAAGADGAADINPAGNTNSAQGVQASGRVLGQTSVVGGRAFVFIDNSADVHGKSAPSAQGQSGGTSAGGAQDGGSKGQDAADSSKSSLQFPDSKPAVESGADPDAAETEKGGAAGGQEENGQEAVSDNAAGAALTDASGYTDGLDGKKRSFPKYTIVDDKIAAQAYYKDTELSSYEFPEQVRRIGDFAFSRSGLSSVKIPEGVEEIGYGAFYHCDSLKEVIIPATVTSIEAAAFDKTPWLEDWQKGGNVNDYMIVGDGILLSYKGKESKITVPEGVKQIAAGVFKDHKGITSVSLPNTLQIIGEDAFAGCSNLTSVSGGVAAEQIGDRAFEGCPINTIRIPQTVRQIGLLAYDRPEGAVEGNAVVFMGSTLPGLGYGKSATRLSNESCRGLAFEGVRVAVVSDSINNFTGTVLDKEQSGFRGLICSVVQEASGGQEGILKIKSSTQEEPDIPESVTIYGGSYRFVDASGNPAGGTGGGEARTQETPEAGGGPAGEGNAAGASDSEEAKGAGQPAAAVRVLSNSSVLPQDALITALLPGQASSFYLTIRDSNDAKQRILDAYHTLYGSENDPDLYGFDIALYDDAMNIPISKLGSSTMKIKMPLPEGVGPDNLHIVCTDEDGQLEDLEYQYYTLDGKGAVEFSVKHFSPYGVYQYGGGAQAAADDGNPFTAGTRRKDASPDTGDWIHPKWFLAIGLFASAMVVFFGGRRKYAPGMKGN